MYTFRLTLVVSVIALSLASLSPVSAAGHWDLTHPQFFTTGLLSYDNSGTSHEGGDTVTYCNIDGLRPVYLNCKAVQSTDCQLGESADTACPHFSPTSAAVVTTGMGICCTVSWISDNGDSPPGYVWVKYHTHSGSHVWSANSTVAGNTTAYNADGGTFTQSKTPGDSHVEAGGYHWLWTRVVGNSVTLSLQGHAEATLNYCPSGHLIAAFSAGIDDIQASAPQLPIDSDPAPWNVNVVYCPISPRFAPGVGGQLSGGDPVNLGNGTHLFLPSPDITVYNPHGPDVVYQRNYYAQRAESGYSTTGLAKGWVDGYDVHLDYIPTTGFRLRYPNGQLDALGMEKSGETLTGNLPVAKGTPFHASGVLSSSGNTWQSVCVTWKDGTTWTFVPAENNVFRLCKITDKTGHFISILRDSGNGYRVATVTDDCSPANTLLTFAYSGANLASITDAYGRSICYGYTTSGDSTLLTTVSRLVLSGTSNAPAESTYGYQTIAGCPHLVSVTSPSPTGTGVSTESVVYDELNGRVSALVDANGNRTCFDYSISDATKVRVKTSAGNVEKEWREGFDRSDRYLRTYSIDSKGASYFSYGETGNMFWPSTVVDRDCKTTRITYDDFGNILTTTDPRSIVTTYTYDYSTNPTGRLTQIQKSGLPATSFTYTASGLPATITSPKPGTTDPTATVTTTYSYDSLGNVLSVTGPGKDNSTSTTVTYNYTTDGTYTQTARKGQPLTVTDGLGHTTHYRYDTRGNVISMTDALGNVTDYTYNLADQKVSTILPKAR